MGFQIIGNNASFREADCGMCYWTNLEGGGNISCSSHKPIFKVTSNALEAKQV